MSHFTQVLCRDVRVCFFAFLGPKDQASLRAVSKDSSIDFNHAVQRGYVAVVICDEYVEDVNEIHQDGEDGHPKLHFAPRDPKKLFPPKIFGWHMYKMQRSGKDKTATLVVNVAKMLGKGETKLQDNFLFRAQFKAVHFIGTERLEEVEDWCLYEAQNVACFTMSTPCPRLKQVGDGWLHECVCLTIVNIRGCVALQKVGSCWLKGCTSLERVSFGGCVALASVGYGWLQACTALVSADFSAQRALTDVGCSWLDGCLCLRDVDFSGCAALENVDIAWLCDCAKLQTVSFEFCVSLKNVSPRWLGQCTSLRHVTLPASHQLPSARLEKLEEFLGEEKSQDEEDE